MISQLPLNQQFTRIGGGLTPLQVSSIIREADTGYVHRLVDLANEARQKDCHLQSLLGTREAALSALDWKVTAAVVPGAEGATDEDKAIAAFVTAAIKGAEGSNGGSHNFSDLISHLTSGIYYGYGVAEIDWRGESGALVPQGFRPIAHRRFRFSESEGDLRWYDNQSPSSNSDGIKLQEMFPDKFIIHQPRINRDVDSREGLCRVLMWAALFRNWAMADWMKLAELAWKPWRFGKYKQDASDEDIDDLITALEGLTTNGVATFSDRVDISVEWPERGRGGKPEHHDLAEFLGMEMSKCVLGQTLTVEQGERGARSLGEVHDRVRRDIRENDAISIAATIRRSLIAPIVRLNFGKDTMIPGFHFVTEDVVDLGSLARAVESLVRAGLEIPQAWVRDRAGINDPEPGDPLLLGQQALFTQADDDEDEDEDEKENENDDSPDE